MKVGIINLFDTFKIRNVVFPNRIWVSPMCQYSADDGVINQWHEAHLGAFINGRAGLILVEATAVSKIGRISTGCAGIWRDDQAEKFRRIIDYSHSQGIPIGIQLNHSGRKGSTSKPWENDSIANKPYEGWKTVAPSAIAYTNSFDPHPLSISEIEQIIDDFGYAAVRAVKAGFDVVEIHAAYGYLIHQFLSPISNQRKDKFGGDFDGRTLLIIEIVKRIRNLISPLTPLFVRIPANDWLENGWTPSEAVQLSQILKNFGTDLIDVVSGGITEYAWPSSSSDSNISYGKLLRTNVPIPTASGGQIDDPDLANTFIKNEFVDAVMLGTVMLRNPHWPLLAAEKLGISNSWPKQYEKARQHDAS